MADRAVAAAAAGPTLRAMTDRSDDTARPAVAGPGPCNDLTDLDGLAVGHAQDMAAATGVTVVLPDDRMAAAVDVRGGGPGTRETDLLGGDAGMAAVDALVLSGGSVFGLDAASGVAAWLAQAGRGFPVAGRRVPIVPAAIIFDLANGGAKDWLDSDGPEEPPYRALGRAAVRQAAASAEVGGRRGMLQGSHGAGFGAQAGLLKGGVGSASLVTPDGLAVAALVVANPVGSVLRPGTLEFWARPFELGGEFGGHDGRRDGAPLTDLPADAKLAGFDLVGSNTSVAVVATNLDYGKAELRRIAMMAHDGFARAIRPVHTPLDGDTVFALATGRRALSDWPAAAQPWLLARCGSLAADCVARAVARAVFEAEGPGNAPAYRTLLAGTSPGG